MTIHTKKKAARSLAWGILMLLAGDLAAQQNRKALFIIADGIPADVLEKIPTPAIDAISKKGGYARAYVGGEKDGYSQTPTISAVGYNSLITGTWVNKHNVWDNDIAEPNYSYWNIFRLFKQQYPEKKTAVYSTWLDNRTKLVGSDYVDDHFDGMELDTVAYPHDSLGHFYRRIDDAVADTTAARVRRLAPDLTWVYLEFTDEMGHRHGNSQQLNDAVKILDGQVKKIWDAIQYRQQRFHEEWVIYITTDHGREENGYHHGGQGPRERMTWIVTNAKELNQRFKKNQAAIVDIMPSMASWLRMEIPVERAREIDGVALTGKLSATDATARMNNGTIEITWKVLQPEGKALVWIATTNAFYKGGKDEYKKMAEVPVADGKASIDVSGVPSDFYKVVIEMPYNRLNRWITVKK